MIAVTPNLKVKNVKDTINYYAEIFGFEVVVTVPELESEKLNFGMVKKNDVVLMFQEKTNLEEEYPELKSDIQTKGLTLFFRVSNIEELYKNIENKAHIIKKLHNTFYNTKEFAIQDINGFVLTLAE
jgi:lactoylglutathione lyase